MNEFVPSGTAKEQVTFTNCLNKENGVIETHPLREN